MSDAAFNRRLLRACRRGDEPAARSFYALMHPVLLAHARSILRDGALAEDAVQSALCGLFRVPTIRVDLVRDPVAWMVRLLRREALTLLRERRRRDGREKLASALSGPRGGEAPGEGGAERVGSLVEALPRALQEVVVLKHRGDMTLDQIARSLGMNRNTVAWRYREALRRLGAQLAPSTDAMPAPDLGETP